MRRAVLAMALCAGLLLYAPAQASENLLAPEGLLAGQALREAVRSEAGPASRGQGPLPLPLPGPRIERARAAFGPAGAASELRRIARRRGPQRVLVGVRSHEDLPGVATALRALGARLEAFRMIGVLGARVPSGAALAATVAGDARVAYVERDARLRIAADPFDAPDPAHGGLPYTWFYDEVRAAAALAAAGGGSSRTIAVLDTGLDTTHPELAGRIERAYDTLSGTTDVTDFVGHGTFVSGLIAAVDGNGLGGKGVAGNTRILGIRASLDGSFTESDLLRGIQFAVRRGADVLNMSLAGDGVHSSVARALAAAFFNDVLPVAASGNTGLAGNPVQYPAALLGGSDGDPGIGLSVAATRPNGAPAEFSTHNSEVSLAAPGAGSGNCRFGVLSTVPGAPASGWDSASSCPRVFAQGGARYAYGQGTSFAAPIVSGIAALVWQVEPRLASEQVAEVLIRSARQTLGSGWNEFTGSGIADGAAATSLARTYDVTAPRASATASRRGPRVVVRLRRSRDRTEAGRELAAGVRYGLIVSRDGGRSFSAIRRASRPFTHVVRLRGLGPNVLAASACDSNGNCAIKRLGRFRR